MSKAVLDAKSANVKAKKSGDPEAIAARGARDAERHAAKVAKLEAAAEALGFRIVLVKRAAKSRAAA